MILEAKDIISNDLLWFYEIKFTYMKCLDKLLDLLVLLNNIKEKYVVISVHINTIDKARMFRFKLSVTIKAFSINLYCSTSICNILSQITLEFKNILISKILSQIITQIREKLSHFGFL